MKKRSVLLLAFIFCFGFTVCGGTFVNAQEAEFTLEEITVTAEKREVNLQKVPLAIEAVTGEALTQYGKTNFDDALQEIPAVIMQSSTRGGHMVSIRGVSQDTGGLENPVAVHVDGSYTNRMDAGVAGLLDIERIEVLKGPQGTLMGALSTAGAVNIITRSPTQELEASGTVEVGDYNRMRAQGVFNSPINESWAVRAAFQIVGHDGYVAGGFNDADEKTIRVKAKYAPNKDFYVTFTGLSQKVGGRGKGFVQVWELDEPDDAWANALYPDDLISKTDDKTYGVGVEAVMDFGFATMKLIPNFRRLNRDYRWVLMDTPQNRYEDVDEVNVEYQVLSPDDSKIDWIFGLFYFNYDDNQNIWFIREDNPKFRHRLDFRDSEQYAIFGNVKYPFYQEKFYLTAGARYTKWENHSSSFDVASGTWGMPFDGEKDNTDYKFGMEYYISDDAMLWANYSTGYRPGDRDTPAEYLYAYQAGSKNTLLNNKLQLNASAFYYDYEGYRCSRTRDYSDGSFQFGTGGGDAKIYGLDLSANLIFAKVNRFDVNLAYLKARYKNVVVTYDPNFLDPDTGLPQPTEYYGSDVYMTNAPDWTLTMAYEHAFHLSSGGSVVARVDNRWVLSKSQIAFAVDENNGFNINHITNPAHHITNAAVTYYLSSGKLSVGAWVKNIENFPVKTGLMGWQMQIGDPRTIGAQMSIKY